VADVALDRLRADIVEVGRRLYTRGFCASNDGNISIRFAENRVLTTPKSVSTAAAIGTASASSASSLSAALSRNCC